MYWSDWTRRRPRIEVANMDGTNRRILVYSDLVLPNGLTLVQTTNELCYTDAGSLAIRCVDLGSLNVRTVRLTNTYSRVAQWERAGPEVQGSKPCSANFILIHFITTLQCESKNR